MSEDAPSIPMNAIILIVTFLGLAVFLLALVVAETPEIFIDTSEHREVIVPDSFESVDVLYYADVYNDTVPYSTPFVFFDVGGWHFEMFAPYCDNIQVRRGEQWYFFAWGWHPLKWYSVKGREVSSYCFTEPILSPETIDNYYDITENASRFFARDDAMQLDLYFSYDHNTYSNCSDAWDSDALQFLGAISFDQQNTGMNIWSIIGSLLFFSLPSMHPIANFIIALPIWICIVTLIAIVVYHIIKALPFT